MLRRPLIALCALLAACGLALPVLSEPAVTEYEAGPIWNQGHAEQICPKICKAAGREWTGDWRTIETGRNSVCACRAVQGSAGQNRHGRPKLSKQDVVGDWTLSDGDDHTCTVSLKADGSAWTTLCRTSELFRTNRWQLRGQELVLMGMMDAVMARLSLSDRDRFDGRIEGSKQDVTMWR